MARILDVLLVPALVRWLVRWLDERRIFAWLAANTIDKPGRTHRSTMEISIGVHLPEDRVERACITGRRILTAPENPGEWSVIRADRLSVYEDPDRPIAIL